MIKHKVLQSDNRGPSGKFVWFRGDTASAMPKPEFKTKFKTDPAFRDRVLDVVEEAMVKDMIVHDTDETSIDSDMEGLG